MLFFLWYFLSFARARPFHVRHLGRQQEQRPQLDRVSAVRARAQSPVHLAASLGFVKLPPTHGFPSPDQSGEKRTGCVRMALLQDWNISHSPPFLRI